MAKKADLLEKAKELNLEVTEKNTIAEIEAAIAESENHEVREAKTAKAGKRSEKALKEAEEEAARVARKESGDTTSQSDELESTVKKGPAPKSRSLLERRGKKYRAVADKLEKGKSYSLSEAMKLATETATTKFDSSVELHVILGVDPRQADQNIRTTVTLPHGTGKTIRVAAFVADEHVEAAKSAGADVAGEQAITKMLDKEQLDFDVLVATPQQMPKLGKYARLLGPRGMMPNPKSGTVSTNPAAAVKAAKGGRVEFRVDKQSIVHLPIGKVSFGADQLEGNAKAFFDSLQGVKPTSLKGSYILGITVTTTMGPGIKVDLSSL